MGSRTSSPPSIRRRGRRPQAERLAAGPDRDSRRRPSSSVRAVVVCCCSFTRAAPYRASRPWSRPGPGAPRDRRLPRRRQLHPHHRRGRRSVEAGAVPARPGRRRGRAAREGAGPPARLAARRPAGGDDVPDDRSARARDFEPGWQKVVDVRSGAVEDVPAAAVPSTADRDDAALHQRRPVSASAGRPDAASGRISVLLHDGGTTRTLLAARGPGEYTYGLLAAFWSPDGSWVAADDGAHPLAARCPTDVAGRAVVLVCERGRGPGRCATSTVGHVWSCSS